MTAQIWLPQLFELDQHLHGVMEENVSFGAGAERPGNSARQMLGALKLTPKHIRDFLLDISPALTALFLAGYRTRAIDLGFANLGSAYWGSFESDYWIRLNLDTRSIEINPRSDDTQYNAANVVRIRCEKIETAGVDRSIDLGEAVHAAVFDELDMWPNGHQEYGAWDTEVFFGEMFGDGSNGPLFNVPHSDGDPTRLTEYRRELTDPFAFYLGQLGTEDGLAEVITNLRFSYKMRGTEAQKAAASNVLKAFHVTFFDSVLVFVARALIKKARAAINAAPSPQEVTLPGMLFMLDPASWNGLQRPQALKQYEQKAFDLLKELFSRKFDSLISNNLGVYSDLRSPDPSQPQSDELQTSDPDEDLEEIVVYSDNAVLPDKSADILAARLSSQPLKPFSATSPHLCPRIEMLPLERLLDVQLGSPAKRDRRQMRRTAKTQMDDIQDDEAATSPALPSVLGTMLDLPHETSNSALPRCEEDPRVLRQEVRQLLRRLKKLGRRADPPEKGSMVPDPPEFGLLGGFKLANELQEVSYLEALFLLFNYGIFQLDELSDLSVGFEVIEEVLEHQRLTGSYELTHSVNPDLAVVIQASSNMSGALRDNFAWEFLPRRKFLPPQELLDELERSNPKLAEHMTRDHGRLVIVAAPGVAIGGLETAPASCKVSVYRVQSQALVPNPGEAIIPGQLLKPVPYSVLSDMEPSYTVARVGGERVETPLENDLTEVLDAFDANAGSLPMVQVTPLDVDGLSGVKIEKIPTSVKPDRHADGHPQVMISMDDLSGNQRFAYDFRFSVERASRVTGEMGSGPRGQRVPKRVNVDTVRYELVIFKTPGVRVNVKDDRYGMTTSIWEATASGYNFALDTLGYDSPSGFFSDGDERRFVLPCDYSFRYYVFNMPFSEVPEQGTRLELPDLVYKNEGLTERTFNPSTNWYARLSQEAAENLATLGADVVLGSIPVVGEASDILDLMTYMSLGQNKWGQPMGRLEAGLTVAGLMLPFVSAKFFTAQKGLVEIPADNPWLKVE